MNTYNAKNGKRKVAARRGGEMEVEAATIAAEMTAAAVVVAASATMAVAEVAAEVAAGIAARVSGDGGGWEWLCRVWR